MSDKDFSGTRAHIDAETLAAWAEHSLPADAASAVELHLSNCDRCQEVLAAFVRSEPGVGAAVLPFWARRPVQWSAAGLAAAAALVAMIWIGRPPSMPTPETTVARAPIDAVSPAPASSPTPLQSAAETRAAAPAPAPEARQERKQAVAAPPPPPAASLPPVRPADPSAAAVGVAVPVAAPPAASLPANQQMVTMSESVMLDAAAVFEVVAPDPSASLASRSASADASRGAGRGGAVTGRAAAAFQATVPVRWRVRRGLVIERSADAGSTWTPMELQSPLTTPLVAGSATSPFVCWFVGANGVVLLTTDGRTLRRVSLPEAVPLVGVTAENGLRAVVIAADGRKFTTVDGGLTWK